MVQRIIFQSHHDYMRKKIIFWTIPVLLVIVLLVMIGDTIDNAIDNNAQTNPEPETLIGLKQFKMQIEPTNLLKQH